MMKEDKTIRKETIDKSRQQEITGTEQEIMKDEDEEQREK